MTLLDSARIVPTMNTPIPRRSFLHQGALAALSVAALRQRLAAADAASGLKGHIHHSVCKWCYPKVSLEDLCAAGKDMGLSSVELLQPSDYPTLKKYGMVCAMTTSPTAKGPDGKEVGHIQRAFNRKENHDVLVQIYETQIAAVADAGFKESHLLLGQSRGS
jgi:hydroxypyruvate isomerase